MHLIPLATSLMLTASSSALAGAPSESAGIPARAYDELDDRLEQTREGTEGLTGDDWLRAASIYQIDQAAAGHVLELLQGTGDIAHIGELAAVVGAFDPLLVPLRAGRLCTVRGETPDIALVSGFARKVHTDEIGGQVAVVLFDQEPSYRERALGAILRQLVENGVPLEKIVVLVAPEELSGRFAGAVVPIPEHAEACGLERSWGALLLYADQGDIEALEARKEGKEGPVAASSGRGSAELRGTQAQRYEDVPFVRRSYEPVVDAVCENTAAQSFSVANVPVALGSVVDVDDLSVHYAETQEAFGDLPPWQTRTWKTHATLEVGDALGALAASVRALAGDQWIPTPRAVAPRDQLELTIEIEQVEVRARNLAMPLSTPLAFDLGALLLDARGGERVPAHAWGEWVRTAWGYPGIPVRLRSITSWELTPLAPDSPRTRREHFYQGVARMQVAVQWVADEVSFVEVWPLRRYQDRVTGHGVLQPVPVDGFDADSTQREQATELIDQARLAEGARTRAEALSFIERPGRFYDCVRTLSLRAEELLEGERTPRPLALAE